jgi:Cys-tRNA(Pro)/Cys-tRNA(Cys) deacylase
MPEIKTLAMRLLEGQGVSYHVLRFPETIHDAPGVAAHTGMPPGSIYKTLVVQVVETDSGVPSRSAKPLLVLLAGDRSLDLKKTARAAGAKKVRMAPHKEAERLTGLKVGGISPLALLNRGFRVYIDEQACLLDEIVVSAGQRGINLRLNPDDLVRVTHARWADVSQAPGAVMEG